MPKKIASPLSRKATLVSVEISQWSARKYDKKITDEVNKSRGASDDAGRYNKLLIEAKRLKTLNGLISQARELHYKYTKPWCDEGLRILPNSLHAKFAEEFRTLKRSFDEAADEFASEYPGFIEERKRKLNGLFADADYPKPAEIRSKFKLATKTFPIPEAGDFRSDTLDEATLADIKRELTETAEQVDRDMLKDTVDQIVDVVGNMSKKLKEYTGTGKDHAGPKSFFTDSLVSKVRELADLLPHFNVDNDPKLTGVIARIQKELCAEETKTLRENDTVRDTVQKSADDILKDVEALLG